MTKYPKIFYHCFTPSAKLTELPCDYSEKEQDSLCSGCARQTESIKEFIFKSKKLLKF